MTPPFSDDENESSVAGSIYAIAWTLLLIGTPLLLALAALARPITTPVLQIAVGLDVISVVTLMLARYRQLGSASLVLAGGCWLLFVFVSATTGGLRSGAFAALFIIVVLTGSSRGWQWGALWAGAGVLTVLLALMADANGLIVTRIPATTPVLAACYTAYFIALGVLQGFLAVNVQRTRDRANAESEARQAAEQRLRDAVDNAPFGAFVAELTPHGGLTVTHTNRSASSLLGFDAREFVGRSLSEAFWCLLEDGVMTRLKEIALEGGTMRIEAVPFRAGGRSGVLELHGLQIAEGSIAVFFSDVTERHRNEARILQMAFHDELTKLPNRKLLHDRLDVALAAARRRRTRVALLFIDLDRFKQINDSYGHRFGDQLLVAVAKRLASCARASDTVARLAGDEFTVLIPDAQTESQLRIVAEKFLAVFERPFEVDSRQIPITASIGISVLDEGTTDAATLLQNADSAMYRAKRTGRNGYDIF
jgi:diguanylate cyclase (GGDEF)-like protein/PAS domain S-box-containing protein